MAYVDANVFIFAAIEEQHIATAIQSKSILKKIAGKQLSASTSVLTWDEVIWVCRKVLPLEESIKEGKAVLKFSNLQVKDVTSNVAEMAGELMVRYALKPRDAIHAATAILNREKEIITDDSDFDKVSELKRVSLAEAAK